MSLFQKASPVDMDGLRETYPFESHYINLNGHKYHYVDEGSGEPIVMVHGNPTWSFYFRELIKGLKGTHRVIAPDHLGCGLSDKPTFKEYDFTLKSRISNFETFVETLGLDRKITLVVHDWGGMIGMAWACRHPEKIGRLVILNTAAFLPPEGKPLPLRLRLIRKFPWLAVPMVQGLNLFALSAIFMASSKKLPPIIRKGLLTPYRSWHNRLATLKFVQDIPLYETDASYDMVETTDRMIGGLSHIPMLILWGAKDFVFDRDYYKEWVRRFPEALAKIYEDAGHYILEDIPERVLEEIRMFLKEHPVAP
ncbi:MAG: alpha/beta fold hydrolase [Proteobacteria bacterium]|nr:alpha/beta fold hydrolase [Pseudomonadota bacterium]MBU4469344.1 alpha/beta fold hydrolase [Pseudomonadota bacterium]MCG2753560.1 alpha/beta fold hydrolase [Desulfobacteraceae bacterium]